MFSFIVTLAVSVSALLIVQKLDIEGVNPVRARRAPRKIWALPQSRGILANAFRHVVAR